MSFAGEILTSKAFVGPILRMPIKQPGDRLISFPSSSLVLTGLLSIFLFQVERMGAAEPRTYAEQLGWPKGSRVLIFHSDDLGMSYDSVVGTIEAIQQGIVTSASAMMPCPWIPKWNQFLKENPEFDNGLHLTLTSEWNQYRWGPVSGANQVASLVDGEGCLWKSVPQVVAKATPDDVEREIRAQILKARRMGMPISHLDSHMGTLFATPQFLERYVKVGIEERIPIMIFGGHMTHLKSERGRSSSENELSQIRATAQRVWNAGLPVLDDLQSDLTGSTRGYQEKKAELTRRVKNMESGVTMIIVHCTRPSEIFPQISGSGPNRLSDLQVMIDPEIRKLIQQQGIVLTTWRELKKRRDEVRSE
jgi:chitin disaccharide deacetylase